MKLLNTLLIASLSLFASHAALANTPAKAQEKEAKTKAEISNEKALKQFSDTISLSLDEMGVSSVDNQNVVVFQYTIENKSKKVIKEVLWESIYYFQDKVVLTQALPLTLKDGLKPKTPTRLQLALPLDSLSAEAKEAFSKEGNKISSQFRARHIIFSDKSKIEVK